MFFYLGNLCFDDILVVLGFVEEFFMGWLCFFDSVVVVEYLFGVLDS